MNPSTAPIVKDLVLLGGGHSHVAVLKRFGMKPLAGVRITMICRDVLTPYSGMLPGHVAGHYRHDEMHIDLAVLSRFAGARLYRSAVTGLDLERRLVLCDNRPPVPFDVISINTGATPDMSAVSGAAETAVPVKPIGGFIERWNDLRRRATAHDGPLRIAVVGAGAGGVEILLAIRHALAGAAGCDTSFRLLSASPEILPEFGRRVQRAFRRILAVRGVAVHAGDPVIEVTPGRLHTAAGQTFEADEILWVTGARAPLWPAKAGLDVDDNGFIRVTDTLQSTSHPGVFAAGDIAAVVDHPRPKSGVFAVRQGRPLARNLRRALLGRPPVPFRPQSRFLSLVSTGDRYAVASRGPWTFAGRLVWTWKDWIDRRFMDRYNRLPDMPETPAADLPPGLADPRTLADLSAEAMRCGGCGAKVGASVLGRVMARLAPVSRDDVVIGLSQSDDAAVVDPPSGQFMVHTVDSFRAMIDDPYLFGRIAANHALGDIYAMAASPQTALAVATVPFGPEHKTEDLLAQMMTGAVEVLNAAGCALVGGHTGEGCELSLGFAVNGLVARERVACKDGLRPGDVLVLTKPLGTGTLLAADMRGKARGRWISAAIDHMMQSSRAAAECLFEHGADAATDVTGFGLLGHLAGLVEASAVDAEIDLDMVPLLDGAEETMRMGIESTLQPENMRLGRHVANHEDVRGDCRYPLIYDPQTAGGIVAGIPADRADACIAALRERGYGAATRIGAVHGQSGHPARIRIVVGPLESSAPTPVP